MKPGVPCVLGRWIRWVNKKIFYGVTFLMNNMKQLIIIALFSTLFLFQSFHSNAQDSNRMYRIAKIKVDANQLSAYKKALNEQMNTAIKVEPGVLSYTAVADKKEATSITIFEVYADLASYQSHILTPHFKKYKDTVKDMVLSLELMDAEVICLARKENF